MESLSFKNRSNNIVFKQLFERIVDIIHIESPLLTLFKHKYNGELYFFQWIDRDTTYNRWLVYSCSTYKLNLFLQRKLSLSDIFFRGTPNCIVIDIDRDWEWQNVAILHKEKLSKAYQPSENIFFDEIDCLALDKLTDFVRSLHDKKSQYIPTNYLKSSVISQSNSMPKYSKKLSNTYVSTSY